MFECVDADQESLHGTQADTNGALFYHVEAACSSLSAICQQQTTQLCGVHQVMRTKINCISIYVIYLIIRGNVVTSRGNVAS